MKRPRKKKKTSPLARKVYLHACVSYFNSRYCIITHKHTCGVVLTRCRDRVCETPWPFFLSSRLFLLLRIFFFCCFLSIFFLISRNGYECRIRIVADPLPPRVHFPDYLRLLPPPPPSTLLYSIMYRAKHIFFFFFHNTICI